MNMNQQHVYLDRPDIIEQGTRIIAARTKDASLAVAVQDNLHRAAGGGEPADRGHLVIDGGDPWQIMRVEKIDGKTWLMVDAAGDRLPAIGTPVAACVDPTFRTAKRRLHTLEHMTNAIALRHLPGLVFTQTGIDDDAKAAVIVGTAPNPIETNKVEEIDRVLRSTVLDARPVYFAKAASVDVARRTYGPLFRVNERYSLSGKVRLVIVDGVDVNPCSGCHYDSSDVGPYQLTCIHDPARPERLHLRLESTKAWLYWHAD